MRNSLKKPLTVTRPTSLNQNSKNQKDAITQEHADIMAMCCKSNCTFLIFAVSDSVE